MYIWKYQSPLGGITLAGSGEALTGLWFDGQKYFGSGLPKSVCERQLPVFVQTAAWLDEYFAGREPDFTPKLAPAGTPFRQEVWELLLEIPRGTTTTYGRLASQIAARRGLSSMSAQTVGGAVGHNPISIIIPCHRVLGSDGGLTGYAGGVEKKAALLALEGAVFRG